MNHITIIGNLTRDPDSRATPSGVSVCTFTVAVQRRFKNAQGEKEADFMPVVAWRGLADNCSKYINKGSKVAVCGSVQTRSYEAQDGSKRYVTEIIADEVQFLDGAASRDQYGGGVPDSPEFEEIEDAELPF